MAMEYIFYGKSVEVEYRPFNYSFQGEDNYLIRKYQKDMGYKEFFKINTEAVFQVDQTILIFEEKVKIVKIEYDLINDNYKCYTDYVVQEEVKSTIEQATKELDKILKK